MPDKRQAAPLPAACPASAHRDRKHANRRGAGTRTSARSTRALARSPRSTMDILSLAILAGVCGAAAIYLWLALSRTQLELTNLRESIGKAEGEAAKASERAEAMRKKLEGTREQVSKEDKQLKESRAVAAAAKEEVKRLQAAAKRTDQQIEELHVAARKAEARIEELSVMAHLPRKAQPVVTAPPVVVQAAEPAPPPAPREPMPEDPKIALRRAELEAEREQRQLEVAKVRQEREVWLAEQRQRTDREDAERLRSERERVNRMLFEQELELRILHKKAEDNRRAYIVTMGALDLAEEELYRLKHGRERPEYDPSRGNAGPKPHGVEDDADARQDAAAREAEEAAAPAADAVSAATAEA